jgi:plasmid stabilization system protein ParE
MSLFKSDDFIADVERQFEWYVDNADWNIADRYLDTLEATCRLLDKFPLFGSKVSLRHPRLQTWRFMAVLRPFQKHILFYEVKGDNILLRRAMHGHRDLPRRLTNPPEAT